MTVVKHVTNKDIEGGKLVDQPLARFNRSDDLTLSTSWQRIDYNGTSAFNSNTFADVTNGQRVQWDATDKLFKFDTDETLQKFDLILNFGFNSGFRPASIDIRFVIPVDGGDDIHFPLPDELGYIQLTNIERRDEASADHTERIRTTQVLRDGGIGVEIRSDITGILTQVKLIDAVIQIHPGS